MKMNLTQKQIEFLNKMNKFEMNNYRFKGRRNKMDYNKITLHECLVYYETEKVACECNSDKEEIIFCKE